MSSRELIEFINSPYLQDDLARCERIVKLVRQLSE